ncbi:MAG TPA: hypothetical protein VFL67_02685 [Mycobacterium sp.]|nr:hypothetical protein [Mycobacterium sp.]
MSEIELVPVIRDYGGASSLLGWFRQDGRTAVMAICRIMDTGATPTQHEAMRAALGVGDEPPPGATVHLVLRGSDGTVRIIDVWPDSATADEFMRTALETRRSLGIPTEEAEPVQQFEVLRCHVR